MNSKIPAFAGARGHEKSQNRIQICAQELKQIAYTVSHYLHDCIVPVRFHHANSGLSLAHVSSCEQNASSSSSFEDPVAIFGFAGQI